jgi:thermostable 8-oxoguanine DNA glycosylase
VSQNDATDISDAFASLGTKTDKEKVERLDKLKGVGVRQAAAILTAMNQEHYTMFDVRAVETLGTSTSYSARDYVEYNDYCRSTAKELNVPLRDLDRALFQHSKNKATRRQY